MNAPSDEKDRQWQALVRRARADVPPLVDVNALLNQLPRRAAAAPRATWGSEVDGFLGRRAWLAGALAACSVTASVWLLNDAVEGDLPWIELVASTSLNAEESS